MTLPVGAAVGSKLFWSLGLGVAVPLLARVGATLTLWLGIELPEIVVGASVPVGWSRCRQQS